MSIKGQQLRLHYEDFTTYIITLNRIPQRQECLSGTATLFTLQGFHLMYNNLTGHHNHRNVNQGTATASTLRGFHHLYNNFKQDLTTTGMSIKGQQLRLHYEDFTSYFKLDTTTTGMSTKGQQRRLHYEDFTTYIITLNRTPQAQKCLSRNSNFCYTTRISPPIYSNI